MRARVAVFAAALWWGSLTLLGALVVPLLFRHLPSAASAGRMAAILFSAQTWVSVGCGLALLLLQKKAASAQTGQAPAAMILIVLGMLLALLVEFAAAPHIRARENLALWHGVGSGMFLGQWLCAGAALWLAVPRVTVQRAPDQI